MRRAVVCLLFTAMLSPAALAQKNEPPAPPERVVVHKKWGYAGGTESGVIQDQETWRRLWKNSAGEEAPAVDFKTQMVISAVAVLHSSNYRFHGVTIERYAGSRIEVRIHTTTTGAAGSAAVSYDGGLYLVDRSALPVRFGPLLE